MKTHQKRLISMVAFIILNIALASAASPASSGNPVAFVASDNVYRGEFNPADQALFVTIDSLTYRGHYAAQDGNAGASLRGGATGQWGRAFLFASSAKVLQCELKTAFPRVSGQCVDGEGRKFELKAVGQP